MMKSFKKIFAIILIAVLTAACHYRTGLQNFTEKQQADSTLLLSVGQRPYALNSNFKVLSDTLWLYRLPFKDSVAVVRNNELVVAELGVYPEYAPDTVWVKVARDQETMGWVKEHVLLSHIVPVDPISQTIHWFSSSHALPFFVVLGIFLLWFVYRAVRRQQIKLIWLNDIDSMFPLILSWLLAAGATIYNSLQHFVPYTWERYYYDPSLNPFQLPFVLGLFLFCIWLIVLVGIALLDDLFHQTTVEVASFYLLGLASCCIFIYIFFTYIWIYSAYFFLAVYTLGCVGCFLRSERYPYACGACGAKLKAKGVCPHCGALNE